MGLYKKMQTSTRLETEGIWLHIDDTRIKLSRAGGKNTKFIAAAEKMARENRKTMDLLGEEKSRKLMHKLFAEVVVLDWLTETQDGTLDETGDPYVAGQSEGLRYTRGISGPNGEIVPYNQENVLKVFDDIPDLFRLVKETAEDPELFKQSLIKEIEGN